METQFVIINDMNQKDLENYLKYCRPQLYSFAMALSGDPYQVETVLMEVESLYLSQERHNLKKMFSNNLTEDEPINSQDYLSSCKIFLFSSLYKIQEKAILRNKSVMTEASPCEHVAYWSLKLEYRGILFLKYKLNFSKEQIVEVLDISRVEYYNILNLGMESLMTNIGQTEQYNLAMN